MKHNSIEKCLMAAHDLLDEVEKVNSRCDKATRLVRILWEERSKYRGWYKNAKERAERYAKMAGDAQRELDELRGSQVVLQGAEGWYPTDGGVDPLDGERVIVRNEKGTELFCTFYAETRSLFEKYKEWTYIPD